MNWREIASLTFPILNCFVMSNISGDIKLQYNFNLYNLCTARETSLPLCFLFFVHLPRHPKFKRQTWCKSSKNPSLCRQALELEHLKEASSKVYAQTKRAWIARSKFYNPKNACGSHASSITTCTHLDKNNRWQRQLTTKHLNCIKLCGKVSHITEMTVFELNMLEEINSFNCRNYLPCILMHHRTVCIPVSLTKTCDLTCDIWTVRLTILWQQHVTKDYINPCFSYRDPEL